MPHIIKIDLLLLLLLLLLLPRGQNPLKLATIYSYNEFKHNNILLAFLVGKDTYITRLGIRRIQYKKRHLVFFIHVTFIHVTSMLGMKKNPIFKEIIYF
jgi:hypothetical protein